MAPCPVLGPRREMPSAAPLDPMRLADLLSVVVLSLDEIPDLHSNSKGRLTNDHSKNWSAITVSNGKHHLIVINTAHAPTRRNSDLAHELAHVILGHEPSMMFAVLAPALHFVLTTRSKRTRQTGWPAVFCCRDALFLIRRRPPHR